jgi:hypothetical protein
VLPLLHALVDPCQPSSVVLATLFKKIRLMLRVPCQELGVEREHITAIDATIETAGGRPFFEPLLHVGDFRDAVIGRWPAAAGQVVIPGDADCLCASAGRFGERLDPTVLGDLGDDGISASGLGDHRRRGADRGGDGGWDGGGDGGERGAAERGAAG